MASIQYGVTVTVIALLSNLFHCSCISICPQKEEKQKIAARIAKKKIQREDKNNTEWKRNVRQKEREQKKKIVLIRIHFEKNSFCSLLKMFSQSAELNFLLNGLLFSSIIRSFLFSSVFFFILLTSFSLFLFFTFHYHFLPFLAHLLCFYFLVQYFSSFTSILHLS